MHRMQEVLELCDRHGPVEGALRAYELRAEEIAKAWRWPNRIVTVTLGFIYFMVLLSVARLVRVPRIDPRIDGIIRSLSSLYYYIPEIVTFKALEIEAVSRMQLRGTGLDLGCGNGRTGAAVRRISSIERFFGVDRSTNFEAWEAYEGVCRADATKLPLRAGTFDFVLSLGVLDHIPDVDRVLREAARVLRPGGFLTFAIQTQRFRKSTFWYRVLERFPARAERYQRYRDAYDMIFHYYDERQWEDKLRAAGFDRVEFDHVFPSRNLFFYDLMNMQTFLLNFMFADRAKTFLDRHERLRKWIIDATYRISCRLMANPVTCENATRYLIRAYVRGKAGRMEPRSSAGTRQAAARATA